MSTDLRRHVDDLRLVDHHVHSTTRSRFDLAEFGSLLSESDRPPASGTCPFDSALAYAVRSHCSPVLGLDPHISMEDYWSARQRLSEHEVSRQMLRAANVDSWLVDTGHKGDELFELSELAELVPEASVREVVRLESILEEVAIGASASSLATDFAARLHERAADAIGLKSVAAYRHGLSFEPAPPTPWEIETAAGDWLRRIDRGADPRVKDPALLRMLLWAGVETGLPLQLHTGFGDPDLNLKLSDPALLFEWLRQVERSGTDVILLHCYPFQRSAGFLAHTFPHVYLDFGLTLNYVGARARTVLGEYLELAPFSKLLYSSDAWGPPELHALGAIQWRRAMSAILECWVLDGEWSESDAMRVASMIGRDNAHRVYGAANE